MLRKFAIWSSLLLTAVATTAAAPLDGHTEAAGALSVDLNGRPLAFSAAPRNVNNHLMAPVRDLAAALGADIEWDGPSRTVTAKAAEVTASWTVGEPVFRQNGVQIALPEAPFMAEGKVMVPLRAFSETFGYSVLWDGTRHALSIQPGGQPLPVVGTAEKLAALLETSSALMGGGIRITDQMLVKSKAAVVPTAASGAAGAVAESGSASDYSATNVQVAGVDEADMVKTDGTYMYQVNRERVIISRAVPAGSMSIASTLEFADHSFQPQELYVDEQHLIVVGSSYPAYEIQDGIQGDARRLPKMVPRPYDRTTAKAIVYDIADKSKPALLRELELQGSYATSRKIGDAFYLIANQYIDAQLLKGGDAEQRQAAPVYRDSSAGDSFTSLPFEQIRYFPGAVTANYLLIGGVDLAADQSSLQVTSIVGSGEQIYASEDNLYAAVSRYTYSLEPQPLALPQDNAAVGIIAPPATEADTVIYKFALEGGSVRSTASGKVPGTLLNQFSMDERDGYFRVATTSGEMWRTDEHTSKNNLYVLDSSMNIAGKLEGLAPGEKIYSTRFLGNRAYMVTFKKVDPLFVIDLSNPTAPAVLGKLKIPGYSDYLHPYDEHHLIGFGKDAVEAANEWDPAGSTTAFYQGMKLALFDVSDVAAPKELFKTTIGARGTDSELLHNHKALLFDKDKGLLAFPVTVTEERTGQAQAWDYGQFAFQGMYVYKLDLKDGFQLRGTISHLTQADLDKAGDGWYNSGRNVQRGLYIGDALYTLSPDMIKANRLDTLQPLGELQIP